MVKYFSSEYTITIRLGWSPLLFRISKIVGQNATLVLGQNIGRQFSQVLFLSLWLGLLHKESPRSGQSSDVIKDGDACKKELPSDVIFQIIVHNAC